MHQSSRLSIWCGSSHIESREDPGYEVAHALERNKMADSDDEKGLVDVKVRVKTLCLSEICLEM